MTTYTTATDFVKATYASGPHHDYARAFVDSLYRQGRTETPMAQEFGISRIEAKAIRDECDCVRPRLFSA